MDLSTDDNNNTPGEKSYSLRPRTSTKKEKDEFEEEESWKPRGRTRKRQKQKSAPLSKYRRKTANARERSRMREINDAFEALRKAIPHMASTCDNNEKISKIMTLRLAMKYITALTNALEEPEAYSMDLQTTLALIDNSSSTSSLDNLTWRDQLFAATSPLESTSSLDNPSPCPVRHQENITSFLDSNVKSLSPSFLMTHQNNVFSKNANVSSSLLVSSQSQTTPHQPFVQSQPELNRHTLTPPDEPTLHLPVEHFQINVSSSVPELTSSTSFFSTDFDGLPSPVMDFCDLFIS